MRSAIASLLLLCAGAAVRAADALPAGYTVITFRPPEHTLMSVSGLTFRGKDMYLCTREGEVWQVRRGGLWRKFAQGLHEPLGIAADPIRTNAVYVLQRGELTRLVDDDGHGEAGSYETITSGWGLGGNTQEHAAGPALDAAGNLYGALSLADTAPAGPGLAGDSRWSAGQVRGARSARSGKWRGWAFQLAADGTFVPWCSGLRAPSGLGVSPQGDLFGADTRGDWNPVSGLRRLAKGGFQGHPASLADDPAFAGKDLNALSIEELDRLRTPPAVQFVPGVIGDAPGQPVWDTTQGKFGPFGGQVFIGDQARAGLLRLSMEQVADVWQGAVFNFIEPLDCGVLRAAFGPDNTLWLGETSRGANASGGETVGIQRVVWDGKTIPFEMQSIRVEPRGFRIEFTRPVDTTAASDPANYHLRSFRFPYGPAEGANPVDTADLTPSAVQVAADGRSVSLALPLVAGKVYEFNLTTAAADGARMSSPTGWYTLNRTLP